jgi:hypothetical protein
MIPTFVVVALVLCRNDGGNDQHCERNVPGGQIEYSLWGSVV